MATKLGQVLCVGLVAWMLAGATSVLGAQPALERIESQIRGQAGEAPVAGGTAVPPRPTASGPGRAAAPDVERPYLGATVDDRDDRGRGVRVMQLHPGGPAERGGLRGGDLITGAANSRVRQMSDLTQVLDIFSAGDKVALDVLRGGRQQKVEITLGDRRGAAPGRPTGPESVPLPSAEPGPPATGRLGVAAPEGPILVPPPPATPDAASRIEELQRRIEQLERRVEQLERAAAERK